MQTCHLQMNSLFPTKQFWHHEDEMNPKGGTLKDMSTLASTHHNEILRKQRKLNGENISTYVSKRVNTSLKEGCKRERTLWMKAFLDPDQWLWNAEAGKWSTCGHSHGRPLGWPHWSCHARAQGCTSTSARTGTHEHFRARTGHVHITLLASKWESSVFGFLLWSTSMSSMENRNKKDWTKSMSMTVTYLTDGYFTISQNREGRKNVKLRADCHIPTPRVCPLSTTSPPSVSLGAAHGLTSDCSVSLFRTTRFMTRE